MSISPGHIILCGLGHVGFRILEELLHLGERVVVITLPTRPDFMERAREHQVQIIEADARDLEALLRAGLQDARCLIIATDNDEVNLETALNAKELRPDVPIVLRVFDPQLAKRLESAFDIRRAFSTSALAAPAFAAAALGDHVLHSLRLEETVLLIAEVTCSGQAAVCGEALSALHKRGLPVIATASADGALSVAPPLDQRINAGERVIVGASPQTFKTLHQLLGASAADSYATSPEQSRTVSRHLPSALLVLSEIHRHTHPALKVAVPCLLALLLVSVLVFQRVFNTSVVDALYFTVTTITTVGYGDYALKGQPAWVMLFACVVMLSSAALVAIVFGIITDFVVSARFQETFGLRRSLLREHIVIAGLGKVGYHIADYLDKAGENIIAVERNADSDFVESLRGRVPVVIGDARLPHVLDKAAIARAKAVVAATDDDLVNLGVVLHAREVNPRIRTVIRIYDPGRAQKMQNAFNVDAVLSASAVAAPSFAAAAVAPDAVRAFRLGEQLVTLQRVRLSAGAEWTGKTVAQLREAYGIVPLMRRGRRGVFELLSPEAPLQAGDEIVLAVPWRAPSNLQ